MGLSRLLPISLIFSSFVAASLGASPTQRPLREDEDDDTPLPVVIWHGLGDDFSNPNLNDVAALADAVNPGTFVYTIRLEDGAAADRRATFIGNVTEQIDKVCAALAEHPILSTAPAIDAVGFSQGGQFLRGYVERCNFPPVRSLVTFGAQHNGIVAFKGCEVRDWLCRAAMSLLRGNTWSSYIQGHLVPAQYFRDPADYDKYLDHSNFLADINNERVLKNTTYKKNLASLENLVLYVFEDDTTVIPKESGWFEEVNGTEVTPLRARALYREDWIGLRELDRKGGLTFRTTPGQHMQLSDKLLNETFEEFFGPMKKSSKGGAALIDEL